MDRDVILAAGSCWAAAEMSQLIRRHRIPDQAPFSRAALLANSRITVNDALDSSPPIPASRSGALRFPSGGRLSKFIRVHASFRILGTGRPNRRLRIRLLKLRIEFRPEQHRVG
jgi:hypothetical protein